MSSSSPNICAVAATDASTFPETEQRLRFRLCSGTAPLRISGAIWYGGGGGVVSEALESVFVTLEVFLSRAGGRGRDMDGLDEESMIDARGKRRLNGLPL